MPFCLCASATHAVPHGGHVRVHVLTEARCPCPAPNSLPPQGAALQHPGPLPAPASTHPCRAAVALFPEPCLDLPTLPGASPVPATSPFSSATAKSPLECCPLPGWSAVLIVFFFFCFCCSSAGSRSCPEPSSASAPGSTAPSPLRRHCRYNSASSSGRPEVSATLALSSTTPSCLPLGQTGPSLVANVASAAQELRASEQRGQSLVALVY